MPINAKPATWRPWVRMFLFAMAALALLDTYCTAQNRLVCHPAVDGTIGIGEGLHPFPGGTPLSTYANTVVQGSLCGVSVGVSSARGSAYFDQRFFGSYTYTIGYADFSGGFLFSETKDKLYFSDSSSNQDLGIIRRDRFFLSTGLHPTAHSEISAQWARDVHGRDWTLRLNGIDRLWASRRLEIYGYLTFDRVSEDKQYRAYGGNLLTVGVKARRTITNAWSIYTDVGAGSASGAESSASKQNAIVLFGIVYRYGYHQSTEVGHIGIRDH
jgi:hypothetical protein